MRKTSQDGGDNTSITSGVENEIKKPLVGIMKTKRNSVKRKVQNFSHESDDAVIEPLLQKDKTDIPSQSAKHILPITKTDSLSEKEGDRDKLLSDERVEKPSLSNAPCAIGSISIMNGTKGIINHKPKLHEGSGSIHNHMNTNIFGSFDGVKNIATPKTQILVEIDSSKSTGYSPSPLIFTTAKIHTDGNTRHMEPVQVTPVPILSTVEGNVKIGVSCTDNILPGVSTKCNNMINTINAKPNHIESKMAKGTQNTKTSVTVNNRSYSEIPCTLSSGNSDKKDEVDVKKYNPSNNTLANSSSIKPVVSVDTTNVATKTIKSDLNTVGSDSSTKCTFDNKEITSKNMENTDISKKFGNIVDVNKNIETNNKLTSDGRSSDNSKSSTSSSMPKNSTDLDTNKDLHDPHTSNIDTTGKNIEILPEANTVKTKDNKYKQKDTTSSPACPNTNFISLANNTPASAKTSSSSVQIRTPKLTSENVTSVTQTIAATTSTLTKPTGATTVPKTATSTSTSLDSKPVSTTAMPVKTTTTNVIFTDKQTVPNELSFLESAVTMQASNTLEKSEEASAAKIPTNTSSSKVKSTVSTIISTPKNSAAKIIPTTLSSVKNVTSVTKAPSTQLPPATTISMSVAVKNNTKTGKSVDSMAINSKLNNLTKTISSTVDSNKTINMPQTNVVPNTTSSTVSTAKAPENDTKSTLPAPKPSTSVTISKPPAVSSTMTTNSIKQPSTKPALAKSNNSTVSSVKTLVTSSDKPSSNSSSVKKSSIKSSNKQTDSKGVDSKKA